MSITTKPVRTKLFIGNLDTATQQSELNDLFAPYGNVLEASVIKDYGFVHFGTIEEAEKAAAALHNREFRGKRLRVELSTSTVRHRPGQPEPASALRNSARSRPPMTGSIGPTRYNAGINLSGAGGGGVGPIRHNASSWARQDSRPYDPVPIDPSAYHPGYGPAGGGGGIPYDRPLPDAQNYYHDRRENSYAGPPTGYNNNNNNNGGPTEMYPMRDYRDEGGHHRGGNVNYGPREMYDRHTGTSPADPYYAAGGMSRAPPAPHEAYPNYDSYQKYYSNRPREPEYSSGTSVNASSRDYDPYSNYQSDAYALPAHPSSARNDLSVTYQQNKSGYPPSRPQSSYGHTGSYSSSSHAQYYGAQQRA